MGSTFLSLRGGLTPGPSARVITVAPDGERFIAYDDDVPHGTADTLADDTLAQARVLLIDGYATEAHRVVARARALGLAVVADIEWTIGPATDELMRLADHLVLPLAFAQAYTGESGAAAILRELWSDDRAAVVLTDGERGAYMRQWGDSVLWHIPAYKVRAVDTTGAGDCFHGAYAFALTKGKSPARLRPLRNRGRRDLSDGAGGTHGAAGPRRVPRQDGGGRCADARPDWMKPGEEATWPR